MSAPILGPLKAVKTQYFWTIENESGQRVANTLDAEYLLKPGVKDFIDQSEDYARLFAAAPGLLAALEVLTNAYAAEMYSERSIAEVELPEVVAARAAIAKARGAA